MAKKVEKSSLTLVQEAKAFDDILDVVVAAPKRVLRTAQQMLERSPKNRMLKSGLRMAEEKVQELEAFRLRIEKCRIDERIPVASRKRIVELATEVLQVQNDPSRYLGSNRESQTRRELAEQLEEVAEIKKASMPLTTTSRSFEVGKDFPASSISRAYDGHVWEILLGHFQEHPRNDGKRSRVKVIAALPDKDEYLQLKNRHFATTLEVLVQEAYEIVDELRGELQDAYDNMPEGLQWGAVGEARQGIADQLESIRDSAPALPASVSAIRLVHYPAPRQRSRRERAEEAAAKLKAASQAIQKHISSFVTSNIADVEECRQQLDSHVDEIECIAFPGMFG